MQDPWRIAMSTDHPNGSSFRAYPEIIALLMDRERRKEMLASVPSGLKERTTLAELDREYTLNDIAIITRAAPARMLGLKNKGQLGVGADADVTIYQPNDDIQRMFELPRYVLRAGEIVVEDGEIRSNEEGRLFRVSPSYDDGAIADIREWFEQYYTIRFRNYPVDEQTLQANEVIGPATS